MESCPGSQLSSRLSKDSTEFWRNEEEEVSRIPDALLTLPRANQRYVKKNGGYMKFDRRFEQKFQKPPRPVPRCSTAGKPDLSPRVPLSRLTTKRKRRDEVSDKQAKHLATPIAAVPAGEQRVTRKRVRFADSVLETTAELRSCHAPSYRTLASYSRKPTATDAPHVIGLP